ncbi:hypothetical protein ALC56_03174 [Trachymyrmex septentrionalis]|uniref:Uncharacterized protein n=1 Tax=Trachymyrmex septentrionalis TaxID=34720 RepID=A0A151JZU6_9HYME|nr:hypothetical protein ALC56_03174 [Trachymyrmex septentrionalis]
MFDLYQYLPRLAAARLARNGSQTSFIPDVFARAAKQIRRIPRGGRAASPTDRLTLRATNYSSYPEPGCSHRHDRSAGIIRRVNGRRYCMQDQSANCTRVAAARSFAFPRFLVISQNIWRNRNGRNIVRDKCSRW